MISDFKDTLKCCLESDCRNCSLYFANDCQATLEESTFEAINTLVDLINGKWVKADVINQLIEPTEQLKEKFEVKTAIEDWSACGETPREKKRRGQRITTYYKFKEVNDARIDKDCR